MQQHLQKYTVCNYERNLTNFDLCGKKIMGTALNFMDMVTSKHRKIPIEPFFFFKPSTTYIREGQEIVLPKCLGQIIHEVELGVIIARTCKAVDKDVAMQYVGGYCLALDLTAREVLDEAKTRSLPWTIGKSFDTATPVSRFISKREVRDLYNLPIWLKVNGEFRQNSNTSNLIFKISDLVAIASKDITLQPMDMILTGTPPGPSAILPGDVIECGLGNIAKMTFKVRK